MKDNIAQKRQKPDSFPDSEAHKWPDLPPHCCSMPDPNKVLSDEKAALLKKQEDEAYQRFLKNRNRYKPTATGLKE